MVWDEQEAKPVRSAVVGENLSDFSVAELEMRINALKAEIVRVETELNAKRARNAAAANLFKS